ncbi:MAG: decarboxylase [Lachnospiraceae bacterium]|nr:decarboxylase [Lachnospiraceae bacterium]
MLYDELEAWAENGRLPFHMPGHKRRGSGHYDEWFRHDITEIPGFDCLGEASGILKEAQERAAELYGADRSFYLVNGSTAGILAAISAAVSRGGCILMQRSCHYSACHAALLRDLDVVWLYDDDGPIELKDVKYAMFENPDIEAVFLTSPSYDGESLPLREIAEYVHFLGKPLIVDSAHGAHFGLAEGLPASAVAEGADYTIMSLHKTLPAPNPAALLHIKGEMADEEKVKDFLKIYQTSSPSYPLMAAMDDCIGLMKKEGAKLFEDFLKRRKSLDEKLKGLEHIRIPGLSDPGLDPCKLALYPENGDGDKLAEGLHREGIEYEMGSADHVLLILTIADGDEEFEILAEAMKRVDAECSGRRRVYLQDPVVRPMIAALMSEAAEEEYSWEELRNCEGAVSAGFIYEYPPGRPLIVPGEVFMREELEYIRKRSDRLTGVKDGKIRVVDEG